MRLLLAMVCSVHRGYNAIKFIFSKSRDLESKTSGRDMFVQTAEGQLKSAGGLCVVLAANSPVGGGVVHLEDCHAAAATGDGRSFWSARCCAECSVCMLRQ